MTIIDFPYQNYRKLYRISMSKFLIKVFVQIFMSTKLREEIEDEIEMGRKVESEQERIGYITQISEIWKDQGKILNKIDIRPFPSRF